MTNPDIADRGRLREAGQADAVTLTSTVAAGVTPTKAEFDALRADLVSIRTVLRDAGIMA